MKISNLLLATFLGLSVNVQAQSYTFSASTGSYTDLVGSTSLNNGMTWDDPQFILPIGFNFKYFNTTLNQLFLDDWGYGGELAADTTQTGIYGLLIPYGADIIDRGYDINLDTATTGSLSTISYLLDGAAGSRILKIEWKNVGFYSELEDDNISTDYANFQLWLYEGTNDIEIHFGPASVTQPDLSFDGETAPYIALFSEYDFDNLSVIGNGIALSGNPRSPSALAESSLYSTFVSGSIPDKTIYTFTKARADVAELDNALEFYFYPNPSTDRITLSRNQLKSSINAITIRNTNGQQVKEVNHLATSIDISDLQAGIYFVEISTTSGIATQKLIKQ